MHAGTTSVRMFRILSFLFLAALLDLTLFLAPGHTGNGQISSSDPVSRVSTGQTGTASLTGDADVFWAGATKNVDGIRSGDGSSAVNWPARDLEDIAVDKARDAVWIGSSKEIIKYSMDGRELVRYTFPVPKRSSGGLHGKEKAKRGYERGEREEEQEDDGGMIAGRVHISLDPSDGSLWVGGRSEILKISVDGLLLLRRTLPENILDVSVDIADGSCWAGLQHGAMNYAADGQVVRTVHLEKGNLLSAVAADPKTGSLWVGTKKGLIKFDRQGSEQVRTSEPHDIQDLASDTGTGAIWLITKKEVFKYGPLGQQLLHLRPCSRDREQKQNEGRCDSKTSGGDDREREDEDVRAYCDDNLIALAVDPSNGAPFLAWRKVVLMLSSDGATIRWFEGFKQTEAIDVGLPKLSVTINAPENASVVSAASVTVAGSVSDPLVKVNVNGREATVTGRAFEAQEVPLIIGENTLTASAMNLARLTSTASITVLRQSPQPSLVVKITAPTQGESLTSSRVTVTGTVSDPAATIVVNGVQAAVAGNIFMAVGVPLVIGDNTLTAAALDPSGQRASDIVGVRYAWLDVSILYPAAGDWYSEGPIEVYGQVSDPTAQVVVNGKEAEVLPDGSYSAYNVTLVDGWNEVVAQAASHEGQVDRASVQVQLVTNPAGPPDITVLTPERYAIFSSPVITVTGIVSDPTAEVIVDNVPAEVNDGFFRAVVYACLPDDAEYAGDGCRMTISAYTRDGESTVRTLYYTFYPEQALLQVGLSSPAANAIVTASPVEVQGGVVDALAGFEATTVTVNGIQAEVIGGNYSALVPLEDGKNSITVKAVNMFGLEAFDAMQIIYEPPTRPLSVKMTSPVPGIIVNREKITVSGVMSDSSVAVDVNGLPADKDFRSFAVQELLLSPGENVIAVTAVRTNGETAYDQVMLTYDPSYPSPSAPKLAAMPPLSSSAVVEAAGLALPLQYIEIIVNGAAQAIVQADANGLFKATANLPLEGTNHVSARALDVFGNASAQSNEAVVERDTLPPYLSRVLMIYDLIRLRTARMSVIGQTEPNADITIKIDDDPFATYQGRANDDGVFDLTIMTSPGAHYFTIVARDKAGNRATDSRAITVMNLYMSRPVAPRLDPLPNPVAEAAITVEGDAYSGFEIELYRNNELLGSANADRRGRFRFEGVNLVPGTNVFRARQKGVQASMNSHSYFLKDADSAETVVEAIAGTPRRPEIAIDFPRDGSVTNADVLPIRGTVDAPDAWVAVTGQYGIDYFEAWNNGGRFTSRSPVQLVPGENVLWAVAHGEDGSRGVHKIKVQYQPDAETPSIAIADPPDMSRIYDFNVAVSGTAGETSRRIVVNERETEANDGAFSATTNLQAGGYGYRYGEGGYFVSAWAMDDTGRIGHSEVRLGYKYIPVPAISIAAPMEGQVFDTPTATISGMVTDAIELAVNGQPAALSGGVFTAVVDLKEGKNSLNIIAKNGPRAAAKTLVIYYYPASQVRLLSVSVHPSSLWLPLGWGRFLTATGTYSNATTADVTLDCAWSSSDDTISDVYNGYVNGARQGEAIITAECGDVSASVPVSIGFAANTTLEIAYESLSSEGHLLVLSDPTVEPGQKIVLRVLATSTTGEVRDVTGLASWTNSDPGVALVDFWKTVLAVKPGKAEITVTVDGLVAKRTVLVVPPPLYVFITSPEQNSSGNRKEIMVRGTVISKAQEVGVRVNGVPATVSGNQFTANRVPVSEGNSVIKAEAVDTNGATAVAEVTVNAAPSGNPLRLAASIESGIGPLETVLRIDGVAETAPDIGYTGPGNVEFLDCASPDSCKIRMTTEGVYVFTVTIVGYDGNTYSDCIAITVLDRAKLDALLRAKWEGMKGKLAGGDVEGAVGYFAEGSKKAFRSEFTRVSLFLPELVAGMGLLRMVDVMEGYAEYDLRTIKNGEVYSFQVLFMIDRDGVWRLRSF